VGVLEWLGAHLLGPIISLWRAVLAKPRPDVRIVELEPADGDGDNIDFGLVLENVGNRQIRVAVTAAVDDTQVRCQPAMVNLLYNVKPERVRILVPQEALGDLIPEFSDVPTTLFDRTLKVEVAAGKRRLTKTWHEHVYTPEDNPERYRIQQRRWRRGLGQETEEDFRAEQTE
jgi:hypothetical protein